MLVRQHTCAATSNRLGGVALERGDNEDMNSAQLYLTTIERSDDDLRRAIVGLTTAELRLQPAGAGSSTVGWLIWHLSRTRDSIVANLSGAITTWESEGWAEAFDMSTESPPVFTPQDVHQFDPKSVETLTGYFEAVASATALTIRLLSEDELGRLVPPMRPGRPPMTVAARLAVILNDNIQHIGQIAYLRGIIREQGWY